MVNIPQHPEDLVAELRKKFGSLTAFERLWSLPPNTAAAGIRRPYAMVEAAIADALGIPAWQIWPARYNSDGSRKCPQPRESYRPRKRTFAATARGA